MTKRTTKLLFVTFDHRETEEESPQLGPYVKLACDFETLWADGTAIARNNPERRGWVLVGDTEERLWTGFVTRTELAQ